MHKKVIVITGASSGIGAVTAKIFAEAGYFVSLISRNISSMEALNLSNMLCQAVDVTDHQAFKEAIQKTEKCLGVIDCLINNAGFCAPGELTETNHDDHLNTINTNILGVINGIETVLPLMQKRKSGTIINISSIADRYPRPQLATYAASKAAVRSLSDSLRMANAKYGIRICNVAPAKVKTSMLNKLQLEDNQIINPEEIAKTLLWIYQQPQSICIRDCVIAPTYYEC